MKKKAIIFDLDDTLAPDHAAVDAALLATCMRAGERVDAAALAQSVLEEARERWRAGPLFDHCTALGLGSWDGLLGMFKGGDEKLAALRGWAPGFREAVWTSALAAHGVCDGALAAELSAAFPEERWAVCAPYPDVVPALEDLRRDYALAMLTNGVPDTQRAKLDAAGLAGYFPVTVVSGEMGASKPDPRVFDRVLGELGVRPAEAAMVGDSLKRDIAGARAAGIFAVQIARGAPQTGGGTGPDMLIRNLGQLRGVLE